MNLIIVESPTKAKTISAFLGREYQIESSYGHVRDLPKGTLGVETEGDFSPKYVIPTKARKRVNLLKKIAERADRVVLATDEDREGEAIAWHLLHALGLEGFKSKDSHPVKIERIAFHEITKTAIQEALAHPRGIDAHLVDAQQARRVLDRLVGYTLSPFLWKKVFRGLSAGRVQSVALRLVAEREEERARFKPEEYWSLEAKFTKPDAPPSAEPFPALLSRIGDRTLQKFDITTKEHAEELVSDLRGAAYAVSDVQKKSAKRNPSPPFTTSTLQQEASKRFGWGTTHTMRVAQALYEKGFITYMRTDSLNLSEESLTAAREWITEKWGQAYALPAPRRFKNTSKMAQEAHEAIRPTLSSRAPASFGGSAISFASRYEERLYELIWRRFIATQLPSAEYDGTSIDISASGSRDAYGFRATGAMLRFDGFLKAWPLTISERELPELTSGEQLFLAGLFPAQHFTEPPARYNEARLVKALEAHGIGRPSTYAPTIAVIQARNYVEKDDNKCFVPTETGVTVNRLLTEHFPSIVDIGFTAEMEEKLDEIAEGKHEWRTLIRNFYLPFAEDVKRKYEEVQKISAPEEKTDEVCAECGKPMVVKRSRYGKFLGCSGFPGCKHTKRLISEAQSFGPCEKCGEGLIIRRRTKKGRFFYGCSRYPACDFASWKKPGGEDKK